MSDTSYAAVSQLKRLVDIADDEWLQDHLSDDGIMELLWFSFIEAARQLTPRIVYLAQKLRFRMTLTKEQITTTTKMTLLLKMISGMTSG
jgi:hypothetical protein